MLKLSGVARYRRMHTFQTLIVEVAVRLINRVHLLFSPMLSFLARSAAEDAKRDVRRQERRQEVPEMIGRSVKTTDRSACHRFRLSVHLLRPFLSLRRTSPYSATRDTCVYMTYDALDDVCGFETFSHIHVKHTYIREISRNLLIFSRLVAPDVSIACLFCRIIYPRCISCNKSYHGQLD